MVSIGSFPIFVGACRTGTLAYCQNAAGWEPGKEHTALIAWPSAMPTRACSSSIAAAAVWLPYGTSTSCAHVQDFLRYHACGRAQAGVDERAAWLAGAAMQRASQTPVNTDGRELERGTPARH